jgi:hypothetical protein
MANTGTIAITITGVKTDPATCPRSDPARPA